MKNLKLYFDEINEKLWSKPSRASIMIGAGFSKNANEKFPDWHKLGDIFFEKLNGRKPNEKERYLNILKLAGQVESALGRPVLNKLLYDHIPKGVNSSKLHIQLLELPWSDILTTNFDTLLEDASQKVSLQKFDIVTCQQDLINAEKPRIIKLHGSLKSPIITEEDYRKYPNNFAPFVNTVRQVLLENTLCLVGFSGDDPNFLQWIGWIRDNLGKENSNNIYLIGYLNLSEVEKQNLIEKNIIPLDYAQLISFRGGHREAIENFFEHLVDSTNDVINNWPNGKQISYEYQKSEKEKIEVLKKVRRFWKEVRLSYPGWVLCPSEIRKKVLYNLNGWMFDHLKELKLPDFFDLKFVSELNWQLECCLHPIPSNLQNLFERILDKYFYLLDSKTFDSTITKEYRDIKELQNIWIDLSLAILRFYREEGYFNTWRINQKKLYNLKPQFSKKQKACFYYESALYFLFQLEPDRVEEYLEIWPSDFSIPFWEAKRAGLFAEIGKLDKAKNILDRSLFEIRKNLKNNPFLTNTILVSQEATIMVLAKFIQDTKNDPLHKMREKVTQEEIKMIKKFFFEKNENQVSHKELDSRNVKSPNHQYIPKTGTIEDCWEYLFKNRNDKKKKEWNDLLYKIYIKALEESTKKYNYRWNELKKYKCDPWSDIKEFAHQLNPNYIEQKFEDKKYNFDIGNITVSSKYGVDPNNTITSYQFLRYFEDSGFPFLIPGHSFGKKSALGAIKRISKYAPYWSLVTLIRNGDDQIIDIIFNRKGLLNWKVENIDTLIDKLSETLKNALPKISKGSSMFRENFFDVLVSVIPEVLSRLCCKCSFSKKENLLDLVKIIYSNASNDKLRDISHLTKRLLTSMNSREKYQIIPRLLNIPFPNKSSNFSGRDFINPFLLFDNTKELLNLKNQKLEINKEQLNELFNLASLNETSRRKWSITSLTTLYQLKLLNSDQENNLGKILWSQIDKNNNFPKGTNFYNFVFYQFPYPNTVSLKELIKKDIFKQGVVIHRFMSKNGVNITDGNILTFSEIIGANKYVKWTQKDIDIIYNKLLDFWNNSKNEIPYDKNDELKNELKARFRRIVDVLVFVVFPNTTVEKTQKMVKNFLNDYFDCTRLLAGSLHLMAEKQNKLISDITKLIGSNSPEKVIEGLDSLVFLIRNKKKLEDNNINKLISVISQKIRWRHQPLLYVSISVVSFIVMEVSKFFEGELENACLLCLEYLIKESEIKQEDIDSDIHDKLLIRQKTMELSYNMFNYYKHKEKQTPAVILKWKDISSNENEFAEIRNEFIF